MSDATKFWAPPVAILALLALLPSGLVVGLFCLIAWLVHGILTRPRTAAEAEGAGSAGAVPTPRQERR